MQSISRQEESPLMESILKNVEKESSVEEKKTSTEEVKKEEETKE